MRRSGRFDAFVWISAGLHVLVIAVVLALALAMPHPRPPEAVFELVGIPSRGNGGGDQVRPTPPAPPSPAQPPSPSTPAPQTPKPIPPSPSKPIPAPPPKQEPSDFTTKPVPVPTTKLPSRPSSKAAPSKASSESGKPSTAAAPTSGPHPGTPGKANGDTLSANSGEGLPGPMALWLSRVKFLVERNWRAPDGLAGVSAMPEVVFDVERDGMPSRARLVTKSGNRTLDLLALRAVQSVESFPPVPDVWPEDRVVVRYVLLYASP
jgi:protein TonB